MRNIEGLTLVVIGFAALVTWLLDKIAPPPVDDDGGEW